jgi:hypothetical protein
MFQKPVERGRGRGRQRAGYSQIRIVINSLRGILNGLAMLSKKKNHFNKSGGGEGVGSGSLDRFAW